VTVNKTVTLKLGDLIQYRRELIAEHKAKLAAIDVLLDKSTPTLEPDGKGISISSKAIRKAVDGLPEQFSTDEALIAVQQVIPGATRWRVIHQLWRMEKSGELSAIEPSKRPKKYRKKISPSAVTLTVTQESNAKETQSAA